MSRIRFILADDHIIVRQGIAGLLARETELELAGEAADGRAALALIDTARPDLAVVDIMMPGLDGLEVLEEVRRRKLPTRLVLLTMIADPKSAAQALEAGAAAYVLKEDAFEDLLYAIRAVLAGGTFISPAIAASTVECVREIQRGHDSLTAREQQVLKLIAAGLTNRQIADRLAISIKTVETHRARIMNTLDLHRTADLVRYAIEHGMIERRS